MWNALPLVLVLGCSGAADRAPTAPTSSAGSAHAAVIGTPADSHARDGEYDGYRVTHACRDRDCVGVIGTGAAWWPGMERNPIADDAHFRASFDAFRRQVTAALDARGVRTVYSSGLGGACSDGGLVLQLTSWRELDAAIEAAGDTLRANGVRETIGICVNPDSAVLIGE